MARNSFKCTTPKCTAKVFSRHEDHGMAHSVHIMPEQLRSLGLSRLVWKWAAIVGAMSAIALALELVH